MDDSVKNMRQIIKRLLDLILGSRFFERWMRRFGRDTSGSGCDMRDSDCDILVPLPRPAEDPGGEWPGVCVFLVIILHNYHLMEV
jgi:hypothetical protein